MAVTPSQSGFREKRRYVRQPTLHHAKLFIGDGAAIPCEIRDYCQTGLHLAFEGTGTPDAAIPALTGTPVVVELLGKKGGRASRFKGRVARVSPAGMGIFVLDMPEEVLRIMREPEHAMPTAMSLARSHPLKLECTTVFRGFLDAIFGEFFQRAAERLCEAGQDALAYLERSRFDYGAQELASQLDRVRHNVLAELERNILLSARELAASAPPAEPRAAANTLALVEEDEFEDWLSLSAVIKHLELELMLPLGQFEQRYARLLGIRVERKNNPFGPESMARAFQQAIQFLDFSNAMRGILYKAFGQAVATHGPELYAQLNLVLAQIPLDEATRSRGDPEPPPAQTSIPEAVTGATVPELPTAGLGDAIEDTLNALFAQAAATAGPATSAPSEYSFDRILASVNRSQRPAAGAQGVASPVTEGGLKEGARARSGADVLDMVRRLRDNAASLRQPGAEPGAPRRGATARQLTAEAPSAGWSRDEIGLDELRRALDEVPLGRGLGEAGGPLGAFSEQLDAHLMRQGMAARALGADHRQVLDAAATLFNRARADITPSSDIEALIKRLERPLLKLALRDSRFPEQPGHPARQVVDLIEQFAVATDDSGNFFDAKLQRFLFLLVDRVCTRADSDPGVFVSIRDSLEKVLAPILQIRRARIARMQESCEGRERVRVARSRVNLALEERLAGCEVPALVLRLLDAGWRQHLVLLEIRDGAQGAEWDQSISVLDRLLEWLAPDGTLPTHAAVGELLGTIERRLRSVNLDAGPLSQFMEELALGFEVARETDPVRPTVKVPPGRLARLPAAGPEAEAAQRQLAQRLRVGDWWSVTLDGRPVAMQLIWTSSPAGMSAFANRSATNKIELSLTEFSRRLQGGLARPGKDMALPVIERSEQALFDETYQDLMRQVLHDPATGLLNRKGFMQRLSQLGVPEDPGKAHAVGILEFDQFRMIYNTCGVEAVEDLAKKLAESAREHLGKDVVLASFRDDTLAMLLPNCQRVGGCEAVEHLLAQMKDYRFQQGEHSYSIGFNIGLTQYLPSQISAATAIRRADSACITAKSQGRNRMQIYEDASTQLQTQESLMVWAGRIDSFLAGSGLHLRCQRVVPVAEARGMLPYYEILLGIEDEDGSPINPMHFIPAVERLQRAHEVDIWVLAKVFDWITTHPEAFASVGGFAINLSAMSLSSPEVIDYLKRTLPTSTFPTEKITFEITETAAIGSYGAAQDFIREMRRYGCKFALDDFGSGFTSYAHLKNLRTDSLKIDGSFVKDMLNNAGDYAMVKSMNDIGHSLGLRTVAEYVESPSILAALREMGIDYAQGYAVHRPCRLEDLTALVAA